MKAIDQFVFDHFLLISAITVAWNFGFFGFLFWRHKRKGLVFPKANDRDVVFAERFASGSSNKSWMTKLGGAANCLTIIVTDSKLAIYSCFPFSALGGPSDLEHLIPLTKITRVDTRGKIAEVEFLRDDGTSRIMSLRLRNTGMFLRAMGSPKSSEQKPPPIPDRDGNAPKP